MGCNSLDSGEHVSRPRLQAETKPAQIKQKFGATFTNKVTLMKRGNWLRSPNSRFHFWFGPQAKTHFRHPRCDPTSEQRNKLTEEECGTLKMSRPDLKTRLSHGHKDYKT